MAETPSKAAPSAVFQIFTKGYLKGNTQQIAIKKVVNLIEWRPRLKSSETVH
jgi:hypothetical protein